MDVILQMQLYKRRLNKKPQSGQNKAKAEKKLIGCKLDETSAEISKLFGNSSDLSVTPVYNSANLKLKAFYMDILVDKNSLDSLAIEISQLAANAGASENDCPSASPEQCFITLRSVIPSFRQFKSGNDFDALCNEIVAGNTVIIMDGCDQFISVNTSKPEGRTVQEPTSQSSIRGPKDSFTENMQVNMALIRQRIRSNLLRSEEITVGSVTQTKISVMHIEGMAKPEILQDIKNRLSSINIDCLMDSGSVEELIKDDKHSIFPTFLSSEKPDVVCTELLRGKVAIIVDGSNYILTAPAFFFDLLHANEDYYHNYIVSSLIRILRFISLCLTLFVPATYVALLTFHHEMIPSKLLISIATQREGVPFPALAEVLIMEGIFEILREASIRMPRIIGPAISIVGALVLGQAVVEAGIISAAMIIVVSVTAIASFAITNYSLSNAIRAVRFIFIIIGGTFGLYGVFMGEIVLILHLAKLKSIGIPYMTPIAPYIKEMAIDTFVRYPLWLIKCSDNVCSQQSSQPSKSGANGKQGST